MTSGDSLSRRSFLAAMSAVGGGLTLAFAIPFGRGRAAEHGRGGAEVTAWLVSAPTTPSSSASRAPKWARAFSPASPCWSPRNWNATGRRSAASSSPPEENLRRGQVWGDISTGASRSIADVAALFAAGRRDGAGNADRRRRRALARAGCAMRRPQQRRSRTHQAAARWRSAPSPRPRQRSRRRRTSS